MGLRQLPHSAALVCAAGAALALHAVYRRWRTLRSLAHVPGPPATFLLGAMQRMRQSPSFFTQRHLFVRDLHARYGPVVKIVLPAGRGAMVFCCAWQGAPPELFEDGESYPHRPTQNSDLPHGLVGLPTGPEWRAHRRALVPALSTGALKGYHARIVARAGAMCDAALRGAPDGEVDVLRLLVCATLDVIGDVGFGRQFGSLDGGDGLQYVEASERLLQSAMLAFAMPPQVHRLLKRLPLWARPPVYRAAAAGQDTYTRVARSVYDGLRRDGASSGPEAPPRSFLEALAAADLPFIEARDEIITLLLAGHETTANTLSWAAHLLAAHPEAQAKLRAEARAACGGRDVEFDDAGKLPFARACFYEALRLYPTVPTVGRQSARDVVVGGLTLPAGTMVSHSVAAAARDPKTFGPDADSFRPERFLGPDAVPLAAFAPFGGGHRKCIGYKLAEQEAIVFLATIVQRLVLETPADPALAPEEFTDVTLGPKRSGLRLTVRPAEAAA